MAKFPGPYLNDTKVDHSAMKYVPFPNMDIGARPSAMPKGVANTTMTIGHVGAAAPAKG